MAINRKAKNPAAREPQNNSIMLFIISLCNNDPLAYPPHRVSACIGGAFDYPESEGYDGRPR